MFSGGDDSLVAAHIASQHPKFKGVVFIDTQTGIPQTREFVVSTAQQQGWPLEIYTPDSLSYEQLVLEGHVTKDKRVLRGFPYGPSSHNTMYYYLKQRQIQRFVREHKRFHHDHLALVTGVRLRESDRRMLQLLSEPIRNHGAMVWVNPILRWSKQRCLRYLERNGIPRNPVSVNLHRSGECLCGALASRNELPEISFFYPDVGRRISELEGRARAAGLDNCLWGGGVKRWAKRSMRAGNLCGDCETKSW